MDLINAAAGALGLGGDGGATDPGLPPVTKRTISVNGRELTPEVDKEVAWVTVIDRLRMPDSFVIVFRDPTTGILDKARMKIGAVVKIETTAPGKDKSDALMTGEITSIEVEYDVLGARAVVRGYDKLHRLSAGKKTKTWDNVTYGDVAREILSSAGLSASVGSTGKTQDHVIQGNLTDLEFLYELAHKVGFDLSIDDDKVTFDEPASASSAPAAGTFTSKDPKQLVWGKNLIEFRARVSAVAQVPDIKVLGWDPKKKQMVIGKARAKTDSASLDLTPKKLADTVGGSTMFVVDRPVANQADADDLAAAYADQVASAAFEGTAIAIGSPALKAGVPVSVSKVDKNLAGDWVISTAKHEFGGGAYRTHLEFTGRQDRSLHGLVAGGLTVPANRSRIYGVVVGVVTDNKDPEDNGRIKVKYPWLGNDAVSHWARLARPSAGKDYGFVWIPEVDEEVVVAFEHGDINFPLVVGSLWNGQDKMPNKLVSGASEDGKITRHALISPGGHQIVFYDKDNDAGIQITTKDKKYRIVLGSSEKKMVIYAEGDVRMETKGKLDMKVDKDFSLAVNGAVKIEAQKTLDIKANSNMTVQSSAQLTLKGSKVGIN
jgi:phage protein D/phage baseplate assembly protein gpV